MDIHKKRLAEIAKRTNRTHSKDDDHLRYAKNKQKIHLIE